MSTVKYYIKNNGNPTTIYVRFSVSREVLFRKSTKLQIDPKFFNKKAGKVKNIENYEGGNELRGTLENLRAFIISSYNNAMTVGEPLTSQWFSKVIDKFFNRDDVNLLDYLEQYTRNYIKRLPSKVNRNGTIGCSKVTIRKYNTILGKIIAFEKKRQRRFKIKDVNIDFRNDFLKFLREEQKLGQNTSGRYIKFIKTICNDARKNGHTISNQLESVKGFTMKTDKVILPVNEIELIENTQFNDKKLILARDWLVIGCYLGQRVSDLLELTSSNIVLKGKLRLVELTQQKTKKRVSVLLHPKVELIMKRYNGKFPDRFRISSNSNKLVFNKLIKIVAKEAGLTQEIYGGKMDKEIKRKVWDYYPKWQLVSSHIMRRSFASNFYTEIPTALLMSVTGHSTEKEFLNYIGKSSVDYAEQLALYWKK